MKHIAFPAIIALTASPVFAADLASADQITSMIGGNTVQGGMADGAAYTEFYDADGTIKANGYTGKWTVENDQMCFDYGEGADCLSVSIDGETVAWISEGEEVGTGTIVVGNPNGF